MNKWYSKYLQVYEKPFSEASPFIVEEVRQNIAKLQSNNPIVTVSLIGYNEEKHLLACLWSLSEMQCKYPVEIIGVDNESKDRTAEIFQACGVPYHTETQHSCGFARLCGLNNARGKYHINIDSDTMYPPKYVEMMVDALERPGVVGVSSLWSYIPDENHSPFGLKIYEGANKYRYKEIARFLQNEGGRAKSPDSGKEASDGGNQGLGLDIDDWNDTEFDWGL